MKPYSGQRLGFALLSTIARVGADDLFQSYCSTQNTGADYNAATNIYNSNGYCYNHCLADYAFAIVQFQECWCSNYIPAIQDSTSLCDAPCPGYKQDLCGNQTLGLYGYIQLTISPSGTLAASTSTSSKSTTPSDVSTTIIETVTDVPSPTVLVSYSYITLTSSPGSSTGSSLTTTTSSTSTSSASPSIQVITAPGTTVTQTVTPTPVPTGENSSTTGTVRQQTKQGLSGGDIAGIVIGVLAAVALLVVLAFLLWRRNRRSNEVNTTTNPHDEKSRIPGRNFSVLSKSGLLGRNRPNTATNDDVAAVGGASARHSLMFGPGIEVSPVSPLGGGNDPDSPQQSRQFVYDQRLNPSALFPNQEASASRVSMQDTQDYSRPLGIMNPDPRASFDSRVSYHQG